MLDNFEHLLAERSCVALIGDLVRGAPQVKLLVTSREPVRLQAEWVFEVQGLPVPESAAPDALEASSAAKLFVQRARLAVINPENVSMKSKITLQIAGGLPVRVEMRRR